MLSYVPTSLPPPPSQRPRPSATVKKPGPSLAVKVKSLLNDWGGSRDGPSRRSRIRKNATAASEVELSSSVEEETDPPYLLASMSGKDRLLAIIAAEKATTPASVALKSSVKENQPTPHNKRPHSEEVSCTSSNDTTLSGQQHGSLLRRGVASLRRSFRKAKKTTAFMKRNPADLSHDSGLGEDSDTSHRTTPLTPILSTGGLSPSTPPNPILRTDCDRRFSHGGSKDNKQVMIREPSLRHLPSALRNSFPGAQPPAKPQLVRLETAQNRHYRYSYHADNMMGDVGPQWSIFYFQAAQEVRLCLRHEGSEHPRKSLICDLIFSRNTAATRDKLMIMEAAEVDETIHLLYKILYHDWMNLGHNGQLSIILHCVQKFIIIVVDVCPELEAADRRRLAICSRGLLRQCEDARYNPLSECLSRTRTLYIQVWCAILCVPFSVDSSPSSSWWSTPSIRVFKKLSSWCEINICRMTYYSTALQQQRFCIISEVLWLHLILFQLIVFCWTLSLTPL